MPLNVSTEHRSITSSPTDESRASAQRQMIEAMLDVWPEHQSFLRSRFSPMYEALRNTSEQIAARILTITGAHLRQFCEDYRWTCNILLDEALFFQRHGEYRLKTFAEAYTELYGNTEKMRRYNHGLLLSQLFWANQTAAIDTYLKKFLAGSRPNQRHLEIGPGHGLLLAEAALHDSGGILTGWDASPASLEASAESLRCMGVENKVRLEERDMRQPLAGDVLFDRIVLSEILEHIEEPVEALIQVAKLAAPGGRFFINVPANSPAPDHIFLLRDADHLVDMVKAAGLTPLRVESFPQTGYTLDRAQKRRATVSCVIIAEKLCLPS